MKSSLENSFIHSSAADLTGTHNLNRKAEVIWGSGLQFQVCQLDWIFGDESDKKDTDDFLPLTVVTVVKINTHP